MSNIRNWMTVKREAVNFLRAVFFFALLLPAINSTAVAQTDPRAHPPFSSPIEGSWIFTVDLPQGITFTAFASFAAGGVFLATGATDRLVSISLLCGSWDQIGPHRFSSSSYYFVFDAAGNPLATQRANIVYQLKKGHELVGIGHTDRCDLDGQNCSSLPGDFQISARRIVAEHSPEQLDKLAPE
jgi:hypothetical protein